ncbi:unnamed protein product [Mytilus edulis]|uniref:Tyr recombinase domain-containing protein n=1 Tax=Mytilus edulis TaxID=6550 RepID=A0A8S3SBT7_MYTED|nr:unnamed protein product [Mytilus edulis]
MICITRCTLRRLSLSGENDQNDGAIALFALLWKLNLGVNREIIENEVDSANFNFPNEILQDIENAQNHEIDESDKENSSSSKSIKKDPEFNHTRRVLVAKRKALKSLGKGSKPNRAEPLTTEEIQILREKGVIGTQNPDANAVFLNNATYFGLRGRLDHVNMTWGDVKLKATSDGKEYLEFNDTLTDEHRFYLRPLDNKHEEIWYTRQTIGKDKLCKMVKNMAEKGDLQGRKVNHSGRKTFATTLLQNGRPANEVAQLGGWKGISTLTHYSVPSIEQQQQASHTISKVMLPNSDLQTTSDSEEPCELSNSNTLVHNNLNANVSNTNNQTANKHDNPMAMFAGATITGGVFNINIYSGERKNTINCSQEL